MTTTVVITMADHLPGPEAMACMVGTLPHHVDNDVSRYYGHRAVSFGRAFVRSVLAGRGHLYLVPEP